ncbi:MAG: cysteine--tRNA ligase [Bdellovibrionales bacterium]
MSLKLYNTLAREKQTFRPREEGRVRMYVCGPTVYNFLHVGNFRGPVVFNMLRNWLEKSGYKVEYALNFTDIDDRILDRAEKEKVTPLEISERYIAEYKTDFHKLGLKAHEYNPKVTESLDSIEEIIQKLLDQKKAYNVEGDIYFQVDQFPQYGQLSGRNLDELITGTRVDTIESKKAPMDFALWKKAKPGEASWGSRWGAGRPGWHIECSAMIDKIFNGQVDIHGGGIDLVFPHHENEIAQSEGASPKEFVRCWMHVNMLNFGGQKMSKSLGNIVSLREFAEKYPVELYKWLILSSHYRSVLDFGDESLERALRSLARIYSALAVAESFLVEEVNLQNIPEVELVKAKESLGINKASLKVKESFDDDLNTPEVWAQVFEVVRQFNSQLKRGIKISPTVLAKAYEFRNWIRNLGEVMSLFQLPAQKFLMEMDDLILAKKELKRSDIEKLVQERSQARVNKDFAKSDELRKKLDEMGIAVMDSPTGTYWETIK